VERPPATTRLPAYVRARAAGVPGELARGIWPGLGSETARLAAQDTGARVVADGPVAAAALLGLARRRAVVYSAHNLESGFRHRLSDSRLTHSGLERFERRLLRRFHESWMVSEADLRGARELEPTATLRLVPNVVDVAAIDPLPPRSGQRRVLFLADMRYEPNRIAARFLLEDVMPLVWTAAPEVTLTVAGIGSDELSHPDPRVTIAGFVDEVEPLYAAAGCAAVPLLEGGGSPLKFVEALAYGIPVVATARAAAGLTARPGVEYFAGGDDGGSFAAALLRALEPGPAGAVATAGRRLAEREYSIEALARLLT
jgi:polysaccharide biosynthesis protein PslH